MKLIDRFNVLKHPAASLSMIVTFAVVLFVLHIGQESVWNDEWFTANLVRQPSLKAFYDELIYTENTPPLYFLLVRWWSDLLRSDAMIPLRLLSALFSVGSVILIYMIGTALWSPAVGLLSALLCGTSPYVVWYAQEARNPAMEMFLSLLMFYRFFRYCRSGTYRDLFWLFLSDCAGVYTHYFLVLLLPAQFLYLVMYTEKRVRIRGVVMLVLVGVAGALWMPSLIEQARMNRASWLEPPTILFPVQCLSAFCAGIFYEENRVAAYLSVLLLGVFAIVGCMDWSFLKQRKTIAARYDTRLLMIWFFFLSPLVLALCISLKKPILYEGKRYLILILPYFLIMSARGILALKLKMRVYTCIALVVLLNLIHVSYLYNGYQKRSWTSIASFIRHSAGGNDALFSTDYSAGKILEYCGIGTVKRIEIPDFRVYKKYLRDYRRLWYITVVDQTQEEVVFDSSLPVLLSRSRTTAHGLVLRIKLYDCSDL
ncbi:MAG: glycosyltransferase family 39 protein [Candidatus Auribacterota bacterium]